LKAKQLARAKQLLDRGWSIDRAARKSGYATKRAFFRSFHDATGSTPEQFRRREQNVT
jgi:AraC-like DNA-binding protein